ncbi:MAG: orotate phosphoribosyltransferase [Candidatus Magasanikbacteria bacterium RIFCSPHIGHO2_01_FULL_41_23]|uniref:Orotate phosphoribosyltransferase n=1 Tax=Candidatus Magasanikbacteria bacterium RIFCSPLOWO2_01_FULL_40_15 TaxID=1798686 RepID=A0A1F6N4A9_9BACT|nr:MAG: orotate phosphoribosyltransferase [Candidatus Magasanikbacteria bacterium RIFCSPHIGHO2_01_FULL_41_23]OGH67227.1 MAG: orotate phosphoribosyltransferase [Candidatus Magasanikbacteria bacterium RIFCSPHIGHO2_02_FULL_41_35]OGH74517.1 MAG: orotate phosphoribosyltransferase [Candidatus Magasanikbacteria bacterium RIFCSPHIGHO2_12_FULL_41_16]OGH78530.1 MAG: orotate phosphoribosyltransferase [Candidatus Magasanikbacteria bacterium RIFCSPLOWO2_01_FULL_40_15]
MIKEELIIELHNINAIKFGEFKLKSGIMSPIYLDIRVIISYPKLLQSVVALMWKKISDQHFDLICGVPYTALPIATVMSVEHNVPMVMRRKEVKEYGLKKAIEGNFQPDQNVLVVEDLVTSGSSVFETIAPLEHEGLKVTDIVVLIDREQGGRQHISKKGYNLHSVFTISEMLTVLEAEGKLNDAMVQNVQQFIKGNQV